MKQILWRSCSCPHCQQNLDLQEKPLHAKINRMLSLLDEKNQLLLTAHMLLKGWLNLTELALVSGIDKDLINQRAADLAKEISIPNLVSSFLRSSQQLAADDATRATLKAVFDRNIFTSENTAQNMHSSLYKSFQGKGERVSIKLRFPQKELYLSYPNTVDSLININRYLLNQDNFAEVKALGKLPAVERIYEIGANIGIKVLLFNLLFPLSEIVCVEPVAENLSYLRDNLGENKIRSKIVAAMAGDKNSVATLHIYQANHPAHNPWKIFQGKTVEREVPARRYDEFITGQDYGISININGGEHILTKFPDIIKNAAWINGWIFYGDFLSAETALDFDLLLQEYFDVEDLGLLIFDENIFGKSFLARRKTAQAK